MHKPMRLPNGYGEITKVTSKPLRNPYRVRLVIARQPNGRPKYKTLAYFPSYNEAYSALVEYHKDPYNLDSSIPMNELFKRWYGEYSKTVSKSSCRYVTSAWKYCEEIYAQPVNTVRTVHIKALLDSCENPKTAVRIKTVLNMLCDYACTYDLMSKNYARNMKLARQEIKPEKEHIIFTDDEMRTLWKNVDDWFVKLILIQCYTGWRPQEMGLIRREDVDIMRWTIKGGMKTAAGKDRLVPIHPRIRVIVEQLVREAYALESEYAFPNINGSKLTYDTYYRRFEKTIEKYGLNTNHRAHDGRKHFVTQCKKYGVDEYAIKYMVGHRIDDITEKVYTERSTEWLAKELAKVH